MVKGAVKCIIGSLCAAMVIAAVILIVMVVAVTETAKTIASNSGNVNVTEFNSTIIISDSISSDSDSNFTSYDIDNNGYLDSSEFQNVFNQEKDLDGDGFVTSSDLSEPFFSLYLAAIDQNGDNKLSASEMYQHYDANSNGQLTESEISSAETQLLDSSSGDMSSNDSPMSDDFFGDSDSVSIEVSSDSNFASYDIDNNGYLDSSEFQNLFNQEKDLDGDGFVTSSDLSEPFFSLYLAAIDQNGDNQISSSEMYQYYDTNSDGQLTEIEMGLAETQLILSSGLVDLSSDSSFGDSSSSGSGSVSIEVSSDSNFASYDIDNNGYLDANEFQNEFNQEKDLDGDGFVTSSDLPEPFFSLYLAAMDQNGDNKLSASEVYHHYDANSNGQLTEIEISSAQTQLLLSSMSG